MSSSMRSFGIALLLCTTARAGEPVVDFQRDIKPILAAKCSTCHGPDANKRQAERRFDHREGLLGGKNLDPVVVPGKPDDSDLYERIISDEEDVHMPPGQNLSKEEIATIKRWIKQGAKWKPHWAYQPLRRPAVPKVANAKWVKTPIDNFILHEQQQRHLSPSKEAARRTLIRRLSFDLLGLPPSPAEVDAFVADKSPDALEKLVARLMKSAHYGERMSQMWLDLVRYADTNGIHGDNHRDHYLYRDYVIDAFNTDKPFDRFTIEQLAGDLLPFKTPAQRREQLIASGYNRLLMTTREGGAQAKEYRAKYAADRVRNASEVWMASTLGCAQCHTHKFDPFPTRDFYRFAAFFADIREVPVGRQVPKKFPTQKQQTELDRLAKEIAKADADFNRLTPERRKAYESWLSLHEPPTWNGNEQLPAGVRKLFAVPAAKRNKKQKQQLFDHFRNTSKEFAPARKSAITLKAARKRIESSVAQTLVTETEKPKTTRVYPRGNWLDDSGEVVLPGVPSSFGNLSSTQQKRLSRLELAKWIVRKENPLTARVMVNRIWALFFGRGLVAEMDDFGAQTQPPTHPELLD